MANANPDRVYNARNPSEYATITNYTASIRDDANNNNLGLQTTVLDCDADGILSAYNTISNTAFMYSDTDVPIGFKPNLLRMQIEETVSGLLQNFEIDSKQSATIPAGVEESPSHLYTCTTATGDITDLSTETSGNIKINYTLSSTSAGSAGTHTTDGTYEDVVAFDGAIALVGYTGVVTVNSVDGLGTKTQRTEARKLTHDEAVLGSELVVNDDFDTDLNGWDISVNPNWVWDVSGRAYHPSTELASLLNQNVLPVGKKASITFDVEVVTGEMIVREGNDDIFTTANTIDVITASGSYTYIIDVSYGFLGFWRDAGQPFEGYIDNVSVKEISTETKYYINEVEQDVTPPLPTSTTAINLNDTAILGYQETITKRHGNFRVFSEILTRSESAIYHNADILASGVEILTDGSGNYLTDEYGEYLTV